jgi:hypothetical protein
MSDTFVYIYMYVCIYRSIVIKNISTCILEAESQNYRNCKWTSNCSVLNRSTPQQENTNIKYHAIYMEQFIFLNSFLTLCVSFVFHVSRPMGSISAIVTLYYLLQIITDMYKDSILIWNINLNTCGWIYMYKLGYVKTVTLCVLFLLTPIFFIRHVFPQ